MVLYRVIICSSADLAAPGSFKYDTEAWLPSLSLMPPR